MGNRNFSANLPDGVALTCLFAPEGGWAERPRLEMLLDAQERDRTTRFLRERDRNAYVAAHSLLRHALRLATGRGDWSFETSAHGKPRLRGAEAPAGLTFNIAHTRGLAVCGLAVGGDLGVDVERLDRVVDVARVSARFFNKEERRRLDDAGSARAERFIALWTLKEAVAKAAGLGLSMDLSAVTVGDEPPSVRFDGRIDPAWRVDLARRGDHCLAVGLIGRPPSEPLEWCEVTVAEILR